MFSIRIGAWHLMVFLCLLLVSLLASSTPVHAQEEDERLRIVTKEIVPFVFVTDGAATGFSIDLWDAIANELDVEYDLVIVETIDEQLDAVISGDADAGIAAISVTSEREAMMDFSFPYFESGLGILTAVKARAPLATLFAAAFSPIMLRLFMGLGILILIAGNVVWLLERNGSGDFAHGYLRGVWQGIWWAAATVTTVGYGDHVPRRRFGRLFGLFWMVAGVFILANFTANVTAELTVNRLQATISGPQDLPGKRIVTVEGSTADELLTERGLAHHVVPTIEEAYPVLENGDVQAVVYDYPVLLYHTLTIGESSTEVAGEPFHHEDYAIALPSGSPLREEINLALLHLFEQGVYDGIATKWFGVVDSQ